MIMLMFPINMVIGHAAEDDECDGDTQECGEKSKPHQPWIRSLG